MPLTGHLSDLSLSELIEFFCNQRKTGLLTVLYPQGPGQFYLQQGSVVDARVGVLRGIDAVYFALTLPNARFEFSGSVEAGERTINQPWTQVVLEGLRRLDEGIVPTSGFSAGDDSLAAPAEHHEDHSFKELETLRVPSFLSFMGTETPGKRKMLVAGAIAFALVASVAVIGVPAGWYNRSKAVVVNSEPNNTPAPQVSSAPVAETAPQVSDAVDHNGDAELAAKRLHDKERAKLREDKAANALNRQVSPTVSSLPVAPVAEAPKAGPKKVAVTVTYDESGRVTQASGADATALRIARQKRFPSGKAGSTTITIPIN